MKKYTATITVLFEAENEKDAHDIADEACATLNGWEQVLNAYTENVREDEDE